MMELNKLTTIVIYKIQAYQKMLIGLIKQLFGKTHKKNEDYYNYITETKQIYCPHKNISKISSTKYYCTDCGKVLHLLPEEVAIISELIGLFLLGSILYFITKKKK